jgi:hypothetical protein
VSLGGFDQILKPALRRNLENPPSAWSHRHPKLRCSACGLGALGDALVAGVAIDHFFLTMQQLGRWGEVVDIGGRSDD